MTSSDTTPVRRSVPPAAPPAVPSAAPPAVPSAAPLAVPLAAPLIAELTACATRAATTSPGTFPGSGADSPVVLADKADATVVRVGNTVAKAHAPGTDRAALALRLAVADHPLLRGILLPPYAPTAPSAGGRPITVWPYGQPVDPADPPAAPWQAAAVLLARLHAVPPVDLPGPLPPMRGPAKAARAMARLRGVPDSAAARTVRRAWRRLPAWARDDAAYEGRTLLCHGDWHLGQLVQLRLTAEGTLPRRRGRRAQPTRTGGRRTTAGGNPQEREQPATVRWPGNDGGAAAGSVPPTNHWVLIDVDDLGLGEPAWDLARPAMWFAAGLLAPDVWAGFLGAYREAGGRAVSAAGDPWAQLDVPARTLAVQCAAIGVAKAAREGRELDEAESELLVTCGRIAQLK